MTTLSIVIPALNEESGIADIARRVLGVRAALADAGVDGLELIVVDDGSTDRTAGVARGIEGVTVISHPRNRGYGAAIKTGFRHARGDLLAFLDADGTYPPEAFPDLCRALVADEADVVVGSRMVLAESGMPLSRKIGNTLFVSLINLIGPDRITDSASGQRVLRREALARLYPLPDGLNFTPVMTTRAVHENLRMVEWPIRYEERVGRSKLSVVHDGRRFLTTILWTALGYNPSRVLGLLGLAALAAAGALGAGLVALRAAGVDTLGPWGCSGPSARWWAGWRGCRSSTSASRSTIWSACSTASPCARGSSAGRCGRGWTGRSAGWGWPPCWRGRRWPPPPSCSGCAAGTSRGRGCGCWAARWASWWGCSWPSRGCSCGCSRS